MDKRIIIGLVAGILFGVLSVALGLFATGSVEVIILSTILGGLIGFLKTKTLPLNFFIVSILAGAAFFVLIALRTGVYLDDIVTGAIIGGLIGVITHFLSASKLMDGLNN